MPRKKGAKNRMYFTGEKLTETLCFSLSKNEYKHFVEVCKRTEMKKSEYLYQMFRKYMMEENDFMPEKSKEINQLKTSFVSD